jgi:mono/diheme cytochrome c family protein
MERQDKLNAQDPPRFFSNGFSMQRPVDGTVARGHMPYLFIGQPDSAGAYLSNPLAPTKENLELGRRKFSTFCSPCHGYQAKGDARLNGQFPNPPTLHSDKVRNWPDARIYAVIMEGQNIMPSYAKQTIDRERWAIILYIRALQRALNANPGDAQ